MKSGRHIICEKPVTISSHEAYELKNVIDKTNSVFMVAYMSYFNRYNEKAIEIINSGKLGKVKYINSVRNSFCQTGEGEITVVDKSGRKKDVHI